MVGAIESLLEAGWAVIVKESESQARWALHWLQVSLLAALLLGIALVAAVAVFQCAPIHPAD